MESCQRLHIGLGLFLGGDGEVQFKQRLLSFTDLTVYGKILAGVLIVIRYDSYFVS